MPGRSRRPSPLSVRVTEEERRILEEKAGAIPVSTYVKAAALGDTVALRKRRGRAPADRALLAQVLGQLGASGLAASLERLANASDSGSLVADEATVRQITQACEDVRGMRDALRAALSGRIAAEPDPAPMARLDELFNSLNGTWGGGR